ncbi:MAG: hypothetical protein ABIO67_04980, partial [Mycobacteriales bacterium]
MNPLVRRRLAFGAVTAATSLVVGLVVAPNVLAATNGLTISPSGVQNNNAAAALTFTGAETDFTYGADVTFNLANSVPFVVSPGRITPPAAGRASSGSSTVNFTDLGDGLGNDGPADAGVYNVTSVGKPAPVPVGPPGGGTDNCTSCFAVLAAGPIAVSSIAPNSLRPGNKGNVSILGANFERGTKVQFLNADGSVDSGISVAAPTADNTDGGTVVVDKITTPKELKRRLTVAAGSNPGSRDVRVFNLDGTTATCAACFFVSGASLTSSTPPAAFNDPTQPPTTITFNGPNVTDGQPSLEFVGNPGGTSRSALSIPGTNVVKSSPTSITADYDLRNAAPQANGYQPFVRDANGVVNACDTCRFTVSQNNSRTPTVANLDSDTATAGIQKDIKQGQTIDFTVNGTNFSKGAMVSVTGTGLTVTSVDALTDGLLLIRMVAASNAPLGSRDVTVTLTDGKVSNTCTGCLNVTTGASPSPSATPSATATSTISPSPGSCPTSGLTVRVNTKTINATGLASVTVSGARANASLELQGYSQDHFGTVTFANDPTPVDRTATADSSGTFTFNDLRPASNTRLRARQVNCTYNGNSDVINVRAQETLEVKRTGPLSYTFSGKSIPARPGGLIISLYRITGNACAAGVEPRNCPGETFIGQSRASSSTGQYSIDIAFKAGDRNTRDDFVVKTGQDAQNAPGRS